MASLSQNIDIDTKYSDARKFLAGSARQYKCHKCKTGIVGSWKARQKVCLFHHQCAILRTLSNRRSA